MSTTTERPGTTEPTAETGHGPAVAEVDLLQDGLEPVFPGSLRPGDRYAAMDAAGQVRTGTVAAGGLPALPGVDYYLLERVRLTRLPVSTSGWAQRARDGAWLVGSTDASVAFHTVVTEGLHVWTRTFSAELLSAFVELRPPSYRP